MPFIQRLSRAMDANPVRARLAAAALLIAAAIAAGLWFFREFLQPVLGPAERVPASIGMTIEPLDPRSGTQAGGSQALFFELRASGNDAPPMLQALKDDGSVAVWEVIRRSAGAQHPIGFYADFAYQAPSYAPDCVIREWGVSSRAVPPPRHGVALLYASPADRGAATTSTALVEMAPSPKAGSGAAEKRFVPVARWSQGGWATVRLAPGKTARILFSLEAAGAPVDEGEVPESGVPASELRAYARVSIGGTDTVIESSNALYAVWVDEARMLSIDGSIEPAVENLRSLAYQPRRPMAEPSIADKAPAPDPAEKASPASASPGEAYVVQLGAFREESHARRLAARMTAAGFECAVSRIEPRGGTALYRVQLMPALPRREAEFLRAKLDRAIPGLQPIAVREDR